MDNIEKLPILNFKHFCYTLGVVPSSYLDTLTDTELKIWLCKFLCDEVIPTVNNNAQATQELQELFTELRNYVNEYFSNLDVEKEISDKLDQLAANGTLSKLLETYTKDFTNRINVQDTKINNLQDSLNNSIEQFKNIVSGAPAGVFATLSDLAEANSQGKLDTTKIYIVEEDGCWYYYNGEQWSAGGTYQATKIANNSIAPEITNFKKTCGLMPSAGWIIGSALNASGNPTKAENSSYNENYVDLNGAKRIYTTKFNSKLYVKFYDNNKSYISDCIFSNVLVRDVPTNAKYVRFTVQERFSILPENYQQIFTEEQWLETSNVLQKAKDLTNYVDIKANDVIINKSKLAILTTGYATSTDTATVDRNNAILNFTQDANTTKIHGLKFKHNLQVNDILQVDLSNNPYNIQYLSLYNNNVKKISDITIENGKGELLITQEIFEKLGDINILNLTQSFTTSTINQEFNIPIKRSVKNDYFTVQDFIENYNTNNVSNKKYNAIFLGDSITALKGDRSWIQYFSNIIPLDNITNVAVSGAQLKDTSENQEYSGDPQYFPNNPDNVLGCQVQKILNNNYSAPDFIIIAIGTNGGIEIQDKENLKNTWYTENGEIVPLTSVNRQTDAGAFRWCLETLRNKYPNAIIAWCSPIQANYKTRDLANIVKWGENLNLLCNYGSCIFINTEKCGISGVTETQQEEGKYLQDGLHPNSAGAKLIGKYNACNFKKYLDAID